MFLRVLAVSVLFLSTNCFAGSQDFWTIDEYLKLNPEQRELMKSFSQIIRDEAKRVNVKKTVKVSVIYPGNQVSDYWRRSVFSFKKRLEELGLKVKIEEHFSRISVDLRKQTKSIMKTLNNNPDYLIFTLDAKKHEKLIGKLLQKGTTKIILQNITTPRKSWGKNQPFLYVGFDHLEGSKILADYLINKLDANAKYSLMFFTKGYVSNMRGNEFIKYLKSKNKFKLVSTYYTDGNLEKAMKATDDVIAHKHKLGFIYACATDVAFGVVKSAKKNNKLGQFIINGWGGGGRELDAIVKGELDVTVMRMNDDNGVAMAEAIKLDMLGKSELVPTVYSGDFKLVEKGISKKVLDEYKKWAFRYSGKME